MGFCLPCCTVTAGDSGILSPTERLLCGEAPGQLMAVLTFPSVCFTSSALSCSLLSTHQRQIETSQAPHMLRHHLPSSPRPDGHWCPKRSPMPACSAQTPAGPCKVWGVHICCVRSSLNAIEHPPLASPSSASGLAQLLHQALPILTALPLLATLLPQDLGTCSGHRLYSPPSSKPHRPHPRPFSHALLCNPLSVKGACAFLSCLSVGRPPY